MSSTGLTYCHHADGPWARHLSPAHECDCIQQWSNTMVAMHVSVKEELSLGYMGRAASLAVDRVRISSPRVKQRTVLWKASGRSLHSLLQMDWQGLHRCKGHTYVTLSLSLSMRMRTRDRGAPVTAALRFFTNHSRTDVLCRKDTIKKEGWRAGGEIWEDHPEYKGYSDHSTKTNSLDVKWQGS